MSDSHTSDRTSSTEVESSASGSSNEGTTERPTETNRSPRPPGPDGFPVAGNVFQIVREPLGFYDRLKPYGDVVRYDFFGREFTALFHPDHVERVLVGEPQRFEQYSFEDLSIDFAPDGLLMSEDEQWRRQRELIQPAFSPARIAAFADDIVTRTAATADGWDDGETVAVDRAFADLTLQILTTTLFDVDLADRRETIGTAVRSLDGLSDSRSISAFLPGWVPTPKHLRYRRRMRQFDELVADLIAERRASGESKNDLLSTLLESAGEAGKAGEASEAGEHRGDRNRDHDGLSDAELRDQLVTFLFAGHETTSLALTYAVALLGRHDDARERLEAELETVCGDRDPTMADVPDLAYTERVIEETLRLYPPAYMLLRNAREDVVFDGYLVPEGATVTLPQFTLHRDERFWDDPEAFRPDRFHEDRAADRPEYAYFPFGGGPRHCVGMRFAMLELQLVLATLVRRVRFDPAGSDGIDVRPTTTLSPDGSVELTVKKRSS